MLALGDPIGHQLQLELIKLEAENIKHIIFSFLVKIMNGTLIISKLEKVVDLLDVLFVLFGHIMLHHGLGAVVIQQPNYP